MEINKINANYTDLTTDKKSEKSEDINENELKSVNLEESKDEDATLEIDEENKTEKEEAEDKKYSPKSTYMSQLLELESGTGSVYKSSDFIVDEINAAKNIGEIKNLLTKLEMLDVNTRLEVMDAINTINFDTNLQNAKSYILSKIKS